MEFRLLTAREIECRVAQVADNGVQLLLYKDARVDMNILDETFGSMNWQRHHTRDNANCIVSIWDTEKQMWVDKEDVGTESNTEAVKGLASDSFKRACFNWGIGRELYSAPFIWVSSGKCTIRQNGSRYYCNDRFEVDEIGYNEHREIVALQITNKTTGKVVYKFGNVSKTNDAANDAIEVARQNPVGVATDNTPTCDSCGKPITGWVDSKGKTYTAAAIIKRSQEKYNGCYCASCMTRIAKNTNREAS